MYRKCANVELRLFFWVYLQGLVLLKEGQLEHLFLLKFRGEGAGLTLPK